MISISAQTRDLGVVGAAPRETSQIASAAHWTSPDGQKKDRVTNVHFHLSCALMVVSSGLLRFVESHAVGNTIQDTRLNFFGEQVVHNTDKIYLIVVSQIRHNGVR